MRSWDATKLANAAGATLLRPAGTDGGPVRAVIDSREAGPGDLFVGLPGERADGSDHAGEALGKGAWGALVATDEQGRAAAREGEGAVLVGEAPLAALQRLATAWRSHLDAPVVAITGSTGKTSTKDILAAVLGQALRVASSPRNLNTEIGLPLAICATPEDVQALVLEMAMRGPGQIAQLCEIARPDVGVIVSIGPVHLELLGSLEAIAAAKAELLAALPAGATCVIPADETLLDPHRRSDLHTVTFGVHGDVRLLGRDEDGTVRIEADGEQIALVPSFSSAHNLQNLLAAVAVARALGVTPGGRLDVELSAGRGERIVLPSGAVLVNDSYNANPMSMRAALDDLAATAPGRRVAVLGDMLELGSDEEVYHRKVGAYAAAAGVDLLITVGSRAVAIADGFDSHRGSDRTVEAVSDPSAAIARIRRLTGAGDTILLKASNAVGLGEVAQALRDGTQE